MFIIPFVICYLNHKQPRESRKAEREGEGGRDNWISVELSLKLGNFDSLSQNRLETAKK